MSFLRNIKSQFFIYAVWALMAVMFWSWVFGIITDTDSAHKVTLFAEVPGISDTELAVELEGFMPEGIKMVKVHPFDYAMFDDSKITSSDLYIVKESSIETYIVDFRPIDFPIEIPEDAGLYLHEGQSYGIEVHRAGESGAAASYIDYLPEENYYLFFGSSSIHTGERDTAAAAAAQALLNMK